MYARLAPRLAVAALILAGSRTLSSQTPPRSMPVGDHEFVVRGFYQGQEMDSWASEFSVKDTTFGSEPGVRAAYRSRQSDTGWLYSYSAAWSRVSPVMRTEWVMRGQSRGSCTVVLEHGELTAKLGDGTVPIAVRVMDNAVPDFAIGAYLAGRAFAAGDTVTLTMFRCRPQSGAAAIESWPVVASVRTGEEARGGIGQPEPVWIVEGDNSYNFVAVIAKSDRMLLRSVTPQGSVGYSTDRYVRTR
jgi:hypothetical protein